MKVCRVESIYSRLKVNVRHEPIHTKMFCIDGIQYNNKTRQEENSQHLVFAGSNNVKTGFLGNPCHSVYHVVSMNLLGPVCIICVFRFCPVVRG